MNADVEKAVEILGQFVRGERNALGNTWGAEMAASKLAEVTQALRDQETDIARLAQESAQQFIRGREWAERYGRQFARAEKADALLREAVQWNWLEDGRPAVMEKLEARITAHLGANHD